MNIQIFGKNKCFDTKKAQRYFKERRIKYQEIDMIRYGMSWGEFQSVVRSVGLMNMIDPKNEDAIAQISYLAYASDKEDKLYENQDWIKTPIVRNGKAATVGFQPDVWKNWQ